MRDDCLDAEKNPRAKWFRQKRATADLFRDAGLTDVAQSLYDCQEISLQCICRECAHVFYIPDRCRLRVCPLCGFSRARDRGRLLLGLTKKMQFPKLLTLTMPLWRGVPSEGIDYLRSCWNKFREAPVMGAVKGGVYQIELKPSHGHWHIHLHAILDAPFLPYQRVFSTWRAILGVQHAEIDIRAATTESQKVYVTKYAAKAAGFEGASSQIVEWFLITRGKRLFAGFGSWYNIQREDVEDDVDWKPEPFPCPRCAALKSCSLGAYVYFSCGPDVAIFYQEVLDAAGPPSIDIW